jgi:hypothetical protein
MGSQAVRLVHNWRKVLFGSWSSRLGLASGALGGLEMLLPMFQDRIPRGWFAIAALVLALAVPAARIMTQAALYAEKPDA